MKPSIGQTQTRVSNGFDVFPLATMSGIGLATMSGIGIATMSGIGAVDGRYGGNEPTLWDAGDECKIEARGRNTH